MSTVLITVTHEIGKKSCRAGKNISKSIKIGKGCWIGANSTILPGVTIEDGTIIGAGSVVTKNCKSNSCYVGCPAHRIKEL